MTSRPDRSEAVEEYFIYIDRVPDGDIRHILHSQLSQMLALLESITDEQSLYRYEPGKWSIRQLLGHVNDTERVFVYRAFRFARGFGDALPDFDQDAAASYAASDSRSWRSLIEEFRAVRAATLALFDTLPDDAWTRRGIASGNPVTVRALAYATAGHAAHHAEILRVRYLSGPAKAGPHDSRSHDRF